MTQVNLVAKLALPGQFLTFALKGDSYGLPIKTVREINGLLPITPIPLTPAFIKGVINLRGKIVPVVDLRGKFGLEASEPTRETCVIVVDVDELQVGVIVDSVREVLELRVDQIEPPPELGRADSETFITGIGKSDAKVVILVDLRAMLSKERLQTIVSQGEAGQAAA